MDKRCKRIRKKYAAKSIAGILSFSGDVILNDNISIKKQPVAYRKLVNFAEAEPLFPQFLTGKEMVSRMDKYLQWVMSLFVVLFWVMFKIIWVLILLNIAVAYVLFYRKYYG